MATGQSIIDEVRDQINDTTATYRWSDTELLRYLNAAQRQIVMLVPEANTVEQMVTLAQQARQTLPSGGIKFLRVSNNVNPSGDARTGPVRYVERDVLDTQFPGWEYTTATVVPGVTANFFQHYAHDPREPAVFYVYPVPTSGSQKAYVVFSKNPTALAVVGDTFALGDMYINAAVDYMIYRALTKEGRYTLPETKSLQLWNNFLRSLGLKVEAERRVSPEANRPPEARRG